MVKAFYIKGKAVRIEIGMQVYKEENKQHKLQLQASQQITEARP